MHRQAIIDLTGCGTEIADDAAKYGYMPQAIADNGKSGDARCTLYRCVAHHVIDTNGGAIWEEQYASDEWERLVDRMIFSAE